VALGYLSGGVKPLGRMIYFGIDCTGPWWTGSFMENPALIRASLSDVRVTMVIICVLVVELLYHAVMGWVPVLECLLPGVRGSLWLCLILLDIK
jgi:hypothetical protein